MELPSLVVTLIGMVLNKIDNPARFIPQIADANVSLLSAVPCGGDIRAPHTKTVVQGEVVRCSKALDVLLNNVKRCSDFVPIERNIFIHILYVGNFSAFEISPKICILRVYTYWCYVYDTTHIYKSSSIKLIHFIHLVLFDTSEVNS